MGDDDRSLRESLKRVAVTLKRAGVPFALAGGYAAWARGGPEPEHDVDFVVAEHALERALEVLADAGLRVVRPPEDWLAKVYDGDMLIDLLHRPHDTPVGDEVLDRADERAVDSVFMPVLSATDVVLGKLLALTETACDLTGPLAVARALREQVDWPLVQRTVQHSPFALAFLHLLDLLEITPRPAP